MERVKPIIITDNETKKQYTLDFDRDTVAKAEDSGFSLGDVSRYPSKLADLWHYAFYKNHRTEFLKRELTRQRTDELLDACGGVTGIDAAVWERLGELYMQTYGSLSGDEKNGRMTITL